MRLLGRGAASLLRLATATVLAAASAAAFAAPDEIQVYTQETDEPGEFGLEMHVNYVPQGRKEATFPGEMKSEHRLQLTPEFSYGLTKTLEAGLYLPFALSDDGQFFGNGIRFRLKYIAPRADGEHLFWGLNGELGHSAKRISEAANGLEIRPIIGYLDEQWLLSFNPIFNMDLSDKVSRQPRFEPALKITHAVVPGWRAGLEYYGEYGPLTHMLPRDERSHSLYGVVDVALGDFDMNFGVGRGYTNAEDRWVVKAIFAIPFK